MKVMHQLFHLVFITGVTGVGIGARERGDVLTKGAAGGESLWVIPAAQGLARRGQPGAQAKTVQEVVIGNGQVKFARKLRLFGQRAARQSDIMIGKRLQRDVRGR